MTEVLSLESLQPREPATGGAGQMLVSEQFCVGQIVAGAADTTVAGSMEPSLLNLGLCTGMGTGLRSQRWRQYWLSS